MIRIEYKETMPYKAFCQRFKTVCPSHIRWSSTKEKDCYAVLVPELIDIHHIALSDAAHIVNNDLHLLRVLDIKIFEGTLS